MWFQLSCCSDAVSSQVVHIRAYTHKHMQVVSALKLFKITVSFGGCASVVESESPLRLGFRVSSLGLRA